ncbi:aspartate/glutamate racemase family protein [Cognatishimia sp. WU-CL00825]|uniref:aspartate/glutamate racemase family protein n=1 Tax=Cognatishimia sp. WU-CL00825 TaxID=3127658 RepID=UPI0031043115
MSSNPRIALIHATRVAVEPIETAAKELWPDADTVTILEEGLSADRASGAATLDQLNARIVRLARYAEGMKPDGILYTCSAFGRGIEEAAETSDIPVLKPNEAMFEAAIAQGDDIAMIYTFAPAVKGMVDEFVEEAESQRSSAKIRSVFAEGALDALKAGNADTHDRLIAKAAKTIGKADAILLAHFSMARAANAVRAVTDVPVLTSPEAAIKKLKSALCGTPK